MTLAVFWAVALVTLAYLHYRVLPRVSPEPLGDAVTPDDHRVSASFVWGAYVAAFTALAGIVSLLAWKTTAYLGTVFFVLSSLVWAYRWLSGEARESTADQVYDQRLSATLLGSIVGWAVTVALSAAFGHLSAGPR